jgi:plastocyanin
VIDVVRAPAQPGLVRAIFGGLYAFVVANTSSIHNFTLNGPGAKNRTITGTSFVGTKTVTLTLKRGTYRFYCTVHPTITGTFKVA